MVDEETLRATAAAAAGGGAADTAKPKPRQTMRSRGRRRSIVTSSLVWKIDAVDIRRLYLAAVSHSAHDSYTSSSSATGVTAEHFISAADKYIIPKLYWGARAVQEVPEGFEGDGWATM